MKIYNSGRERRASSNFGLQMFVRDGGGGEFPKLSREIRECNAEGERKTFLSRVSERDECRVHLCGGEEMCGPGAVVSGESSRYDDKIVKCLTALL